MAQFNSRLTNCVLHTVDVIMKCLFCPLTFDSDTDTLTCQLTSRIPITLLTQQQDQCLLVFKQLYLFNDTKHHGLHLSSVNCHVKSVNCHVKASLTIPNPVSSAESKGGKNTTEKFMNFPRHTLMGLWNVSRNFFMRRLGKVFHNTNTFCRRRDIIKERGRTDGVEIKICLSRETAAHKLKRSVHKTLPTASPRTCHRRACYERWFVASL